MNLTKLVPTISGSRGNTIREFHARAKLQALLAARLINPRDWDRIPVVVREGLHGQADLPSFLKCLEGLKLLTEYQAARLAVGEVDELILGNYRIVDFLGSGGMGMVLRAEHHLFRRPVAVKVLNTPRPDDPAVLERFLNEIWVVGQLQHPNIVTAIDAGETGGIASRYYFVMEYVPGKNLDELVRSEGPLEPAHACDLIHQIADALAEAHRHHLVHRDIKPSNILVTPDGRAKLLDFGVARIVDRRVTQPGAILGSLAYLAPEQAENPTDVDIRADIFGLGGTLYWCLTGRAPFAEHANPLIGLQKRLTSAAPLIRQQRREVSVELEQLIADMLAPRPEDRPKSPLAVTQALVPFLQSRSLSAILRSSTSAQTSLQRAEARRTHRILIVDDEASNRSVCRFILEAEGLECVDAVNGMQGLRALNAERFDVVLLDMDMPVLGGPEVLCQLREAPPVPHLKVIMVSGRANGDEMARMMLAGADDYLAKPFGATQLQARVKSALRLKDAQDRSDMLFRSLLTVNHDLEQNLTLRDSDLVDARNALVLGLAELVAQRDTETGAHLMRLQRYCKCLAEKAALSPNYATVLDAHFISMLECCAPLHDIGKAGVPDHILLKAGPLTPEERMIMQTHTTIGANVLEKVSQQHGFAKAFLKMAIDITRHHHERFDGKGYPDRLAGDAIPLSARIVAFADVYDAMRSRRVYKPALPHAEVIRIMLHESPGHFDPALSSVFHQCAGDFDRLFSEIAD